MRLQIFSVLALAAMALSACVTPIPEHVDLDHAARASIDSTEVVAPVRQSEIYIYVPPTTAGASQGLIGALIDVSVDAHRAKTASDSVKPLRDAMVDYDFDKALKADLQASLSQVPWLKVDGVRVLKDITAESMNGAVADSKKSAVLMVAADYQLDNKGDELKVTLVADLFANNDALRKFKPAKTANDKAVAGAGNAIYRTTVFETAVVPNPSDDRDANIAVWSADNGKLLRAELDKAVAKLSGELAGDISDGEVKVAAQ